MSKAVLYCLVLGLTYATLDKGVFHAGKGYTAEQLGDHLDATNDDGDAYFAECDEEDIVGENTLRGEVVVAPTAKKLVLNKGKKAPEEDKGEVVSV